MSSWTTRLSVTVLGAATSGRRVCNQVGAGPNENKAAQEKVGNSVDANGAGEEETGNTPAVKAGKARGHCLGLSAGGEGLVVNLKNSVNLDAGAILPDTSRGCNTPNFDEGGLTRRDDTWQYDGNGYLVLGHHYANDNVGPPRCQKAKAPMVGDGAGKPWLVPNWTLKYIRAGKVVRR